MFVGELLGFEKFKIELKNKLKKIEKIVSLPSLYVSTACTDCVFVYTPTD